MRLYTLIIDFDGGTYITQAHAENVDSAAIACVKKWKLDEGMPVTGEDKSEILAQLKSELFVPLSDLENIWCGCVTINNLLATLNLVLTENNL